MYRKSHERVCLWCGKSFLAATERATCCPAEKCIAAQRAAQRRRQRARRKGEGRVSR